MPLQPDAVLGQYRILASLGAGGMGEVYRATDTRLGREVAIKVLPEELSSQPDRLARLEGEARVLASLNHPNIATLHAFEQDDDTRFLVMELVEGEDLAARIKRGPIPVDEAMSFFSQIAQGLEAAHDRGVVHRDLKPANIKITPDGRVKILDFGLAKRVPLTSAAVTASAHTHEGALLGTFAYMSPEQAQGHHVDAQSDVFSVGTVFYEMLTGQHPFEADSGAGVLAAILHGQPASPRTAHPNIPRWLEAMVLRCLEKDPRDRYASAGELKRALEGVSASRTAVPRSRSAAIFLGGGSVLVVIAVLGSALATGWRPSTATSAGVGPPHMRATRLTSSADFELYPSWSPDGSLITFGRTLKGDMDVVVMARNGEPVPITDSSADEVSPSWSPAGDKIAYLSDRGLGLELFWVSPTGGREHRIASIGAAAIEDTAIWYLGLGTAPWSPDGKEIVYSRREKQGGFALWKVNLEGGAPRRLTAPPVGAKDMCSAWSPDGSRIAFHRNHRGRSSVWEVTPEGTAARSLLSDGNNNTFPSWRDARRLTFISDRDGATNAWELEIPSGNVQPLTAQAGQSLNHLGGWGRQGLAYALGSHSTDIYLGSLGDPSEAHRNLTRSEVDNFGASVSANGARVAYHSNRTGNVEIWIHDLASGRDKRLTDDPANDFAPSWSPRGDIAFASDRGGSPQIWIWDVSASAPRRVASEPLFLRFGPQSYNRGPRWSPDGSRIGFLTETDDEIFLRTVKPDGTENRPHSLPGVISFDWYRDGRTVIYSRRAPGSGELEVRAADLETGEDALLIAGPYGDPTVDSTGTQLALLHSLSHFNMDAFLLPLEPPPPGRGLPRPVGEPQRLTEGRGRWHTHNLAWVPGSNSFVYTRDTDRSDIWVLEQED